MLWTILNDQSKPRPQSQQSRPRRNPAGGLASMIAVTCMLLNVSAAAQAQTQSQPSTRKEAAMSNQANGTFEVKLTPQDPDNQDAAAAKLGRMSIDKQFHGDLEATSKGEMLSAMTEVKGSAGYVAIERVSGALRGQSGTFVLQHTGTMSRGVPQLSITVVPDSGTGQLTGLTGSMEINIVDGKHFYEFQYALAGAPETLPSEK
jgi:hypothetical protein